MRSSRAQRGSCQCNRSRWWGADNHHHDDGVSRRRLCPNRVYDCPTNDAEGQPGTQSADYGTMGSRGEHFTQAQFGGAVMPTLHSTNFVVIVATIVRNHPTPNPPATPPASHVAARTPLVYVDNGHKAPYAHCHVFVCMAADTRHSGLVPGVRTTIQLKLRTPTSARAPTSYQ